MSKEVKPDFEVALYNETRPYDKIIEEVFSNDVSSTYILQSRKELRMIADEKTYHFLKEVVMPQNFRHVAKITECFMINIPSGYTRNYTFCIVSEPLNRGLINERTKQSGINYFYDVWAEYLHCRASDVYGRVDEAYFSKDSVGEEFILRSIEASDKSVEEKKVAIALNGAFRDVMSLGPAIIWPSPLNIGVADDGVVKITHIGINGYYV